MGTLRCELLPQIHKLDEYPMSHQRVQAERGSHLEQACVRSRPFETLDVLEEDERRGKRGVFQEGYEVKEAQTSWVFDVHLFPNLAEWLARRTADGNLTEHWWRSMVCKLRRI